MLATDSPHWLREPQFRLLFAALPTPSLVLLPNDPTYTILAVSDSFAQVTMTKREEILGRGLVEAFPANLQDSGVQSVLQVRTSLRRVLDERVTITLPAQKYDIRRPAAQGRQFEERYWRLQNHPVLNERGEVLWILQTVEDVTAQQQRLAAAARLARRHQRSSERFQAERSYLQSIVDTLRTPLLVLTPALSIQTANLSFYQDFQLTPDEVLHYLVYDLDAGAWNLPVLRSCLEQAVSDEACCLSHVTTGDFPRVGRRVISFQARKLLHQPSGEEHILLAIEDITSRQAAEDALRCREQELRRSNEDLDQFARVASHDLRAPLHRISRLVQSLERHCQTKLDAEEQQLIDMIRAATSRMITLVTDLLQYAEPSREEAAPVTRVSAQAVFQLVLENLQARLEDSQAVVTADSLPEVPIRQTQLLQLLQNLIGNALNYRREEPPRIHVSVQDRDGSYLFAVKDNGCGIEPRHWERIFEPFARLHGEEIAGSGIGLAVCKKIVERAGGRIWVESRLGEGAVFYFTLPGLERP